MLDSRVSLQEATHVSPDSPVKNLRSIHAATLLRDFYVDRVELDTQNLSMQVRNAVLATEILIRKCGTGQDSEVLITQINSIADQLIPFLHPDELDLIWKRFENVACVETWSVHQRQWFSLVKAVSARDARRMAAISTQLLESGEDTLNVGRVQYLVATSMLGHLSTGDRKSAIQSWTKFGSPGIVSGEYRAVLRLLVARTKV